MADETSLEAQEHSGVPGGGGLSMAPAAYEKIGRAMHALQDFWSHSNFVERAIGVPEFELGGLTTATFGADDKTHALAHKVRGAADEIDAEMPLVDRMSGRRDTDPSPSEVDVGDESPVHHEDDAADIFDALGQAGDVAKALPGNMWRGAERGWNRSAGGGWRGVVRGLGGAAEGAAVAATASVLGSKAGVTALRHFAEWLDEKTETKQQAAGDNQAHGLLAKDQPGHDDTAFGLLKTARFELAHELSVAADEMVAGRMKEVVDASDATLADALLMDIFDTLDLLIGDAGPGHPLWGIVEAHRKTRGGGAQRLPRREGGERRGRPRALGAQSRVVREILPNAARRRYIGIVSDPRTGRGSAGGSEKAEQVAGPGGAGRERRVVGRGPGPDRPGRVPRPGRAGGAGQPDRRRPPAVRRLQRPGAVAVDERDAAHRRVLPVRARRRRGLRAGGRAPGSRAANPAVEQLGVVAYAGVPLRAADGEPIGTLCALDYEPRTWSKDDLAFLTDLAAEVIAELQLLTATRLAARDRARLRELSALSSALAPATGRRRRGRRGQPDRRGVRRATPCGCRCSTRPGGRCAWRRRAAGRSPMCRPRRWRPPRSSGPASPAS